MPSGAGRIEKMVPIETLVSMLEEPSSGSMATSSGAPAVSATGTSASSEASAATGAPAQVALDQGVGDDVELLLDVAAALVDAGRGKIAGQRPQGDQRGDLRRRPRQGGNGAGDRGARRLVAGPGVEVVLKQRL